MTGLPALLYIRYSYYHAVTMYVLTSKWCLYMHAVECRRRVKVHGVDKAPPESGDTFWQLELISEPYSG